MKEPSLFKIKYLGLHVLMYSPGRNRKTMFCNINYRTQNDAHFHLKKSKFSSQSPNFEVNQVFTSFEEPALFECSDFIHGGKKMLLFREGQQKETGEGRTGFCCCLFRSQSVSTSSNTTCRMSKVVQGNKKTTIVKQTEPVH
jgi:hypothetical protein